MAHGHWASQVIGPDTGAGNGGGSGGSLIVGVNQDGTDSTLDKTWQEIYDVISSGGVAYVATPEETGYSYGLIKGISPYKVYTADGDTFRATSADGYPHMSGDTPE